VVDIGTNDISNLTKVDEDQVVEWAGDLIAFTDGLPVKGVVLCHVLPRTRRIACTEMEFRINADTYNDALKRLAVNTKFVINTQQGFSNMYEENIRRVIHRPVETWSDDGIHIAARSMPKYTQRLRQAVLAAKRAMD